MAQGHASRTRRASRTPWHPQDEARRLIVRSVGLTKGLACGLRALKAGEVPAVHGVRFDSSDISDGMAEVIAYGTAATVRPA
jgi:hypothetical protein